jgi:hypothetical protein
VSNDVFFAGEVVAGFVWSDTRFGDRDVWTIMRCSSCMGGTGRPTMRWWLWVRYFYSHVFCSTDDAKVSF